MRWDGDPLSWSELAVTAEKAPRAMRHLSMGLKAVRGCKPTRVELTVFDDDGDPREVPLFEHVRARREHRPPEQWYTHEVRVYYSTIRRLGRGTLAVVTNVVPVVVAFPFCLLEGSGAPYYLARRRGGYVDPEVRQLCARAIYAPVPIVLNGTCINCPALPDGKAPLRYVLADRYTAGHLAITSSLGGAKRVVLERVMQRDDQWVLEPFDHSRDADCLCPAINVGTRRAVTALASLHRRAAAWRWDLERLTLKFVLDGVVVAETDDVLEGNWGGVESARGLNVDLSGFGLVRDPRYEERLEFLRDRARWADSLT
jgi:hypothetical protein